MKSRHLQTNALKFLKSKAGIQFDPAIVKLLEQHYPALEQMARRHTSEIEPLRTNLFIEHGVAPAAGFEDEAIARESSRPAGERSREKPPSPVPARMTAP